MDLHEMKALIDGGKLEYVKIGVPDIDGVYRGKRVDARYFLEGLEEGIAQSAVLFGWDIAENVLPELQARSWEIVFGDILFKPDLATFALQPWEERVASCICDCWTEQGEVLKVAPRYVLGHVLERARSLGFSAVAAAELELRVFRESQVSLREKDFGPDLTPLSPGTNCYVISHASADEHLFGQVARMVRDYGIPLEGYFREHGPGMYETNIRYADALQAADRALLFKTAVKEICQQLGYTASFMAKWHEREDGSSGHSHMSLWDLNMERNLFWDENAEGHMSETMRRFLAGVLTKMPELMALYAPTINSYKRYMKGTWTPLNTTWGMDNRSCAVRVINNGRRAIRLENRVPGADANFYLVFAAMLACGLYGIEHELELSPAISGDATDDQVVARAIEAGHALTLPHNLTLATDLFERSELAREYFGAEFVEHFVATRRWEVSEFEKTVTNWERRRYFELI